MTNTRNRYVRSFNYKIKDEWVTKVDRAVQARNNNKTRFIFFTVCGDGMNRLIDTKFVFIA